jgi:nucleoid-associated protein YgaU
MGIIDFVKSAGAKLGLGDDEKEKERQFDEQLAERRKGNALMRHVMELGFDVERLRVDFDDGIATVTGQVDDQGTREKVVLAIGNTAGVARVDDRMAVVEPAPEATMYTVRSGDSLSKIAKEHYGDAMKYPVIFEANQPLLTDPDKIYPGQVLRIPAPDA